MLAAGIFQAAAGLAPPAAAADESAASQPSSQTSSQFGLHLLPVPFERIPGWRSDDHARAFAAFRMSCAAVLRLQKQDADFPQEALARICELAMARGALRLRGAEARGFFEQHFRPHVVQASPSQAGGRGTAHAGLLTGYYEPHIDGSLVRTERFSTPLYRRPADLVNVVAEAERARAGIPYTHMRRAKGTDGSDTLEPYPTRAEIDAGALAGQGLELIWLADPVDAFFAQIQGSARIRLGDGKRIAIAYDGKNGHPYTSVGRVLIERGAMAAGDVTMETLGTYLRADRERGREIMQQNASYVFFKAMTAVRDDRAVGALGTPLVEGRSLAVDTAFHMLGCPIYVDAPGLRHWGSSRHRRPFQRLMIAHDVGSAIRGRERGDIYFGSGDVAAAKAGVTKHAGRFIVLLPRADGERRRRRRSP